MNYLPEAKEGWVIPVLIPVETEKELLGSEMRRVLTKLDPDVEIPDIDVVPVNGEWQGVGDVPELNSYSGLVSLCLHGGGYFTGSAAMERTATFNVARLSEGRVFAVDYRLAPQHSFPAALIDAIVAYKYLVEPPEGALHDPVDPKKLVIAGDSAGVRISLRG